MIVHASVLDFDRREPPEAPAVGDAYILGADPLGAFEGKADSLACWTDNGWRFVEPFEGLTTFVRSQGVHASYRNGRWGCGQVAASQYWLNDAPILGPKLAAIADPAGGKTVDQQSRSTLQAILVALRHHGLIEL